MGTAQGPKAQGLSPMEGTKFTSPRSTDLLLQPRSDSAHIQDAMLQLHNAYDTANPRWDTCRAADKVALITANHDVRRRGTVATYITFRNLPLPVTTKIDGLHAMFVRTKGNMATQDP